LPFEGVVFGAQRDEYATKNGSPSALYRATFQFRMKDEQAARTYKPIVRFIWVMVSSKLASLGVPLTPNEPLEQQGATFTSQSFVISAQQITDVTLALSGIKNEASEQRSAGDIQPWASILHATRIGGLAAPALPLQTQQ